MRPRTHALLSAGWLVLAPACAESDPDPAPDDVGDATTDTTGPETDSETDSETDTAYTTDTGESASEHETETGDETDSETTDDPPPLDVGGEDPPPSPCGELALDWDIPFAGRIESVTLSENGGVLAAQSDLDPYPTTQVLRISPEGVVQSGLARPFIAGESSFNLVHVIAGQAGGFSVFGRIVNTPVVETYDALDSLVDEWFAPDQPELEDTLYPTHLARASTGEFVALGHNGAFGYLWLQTFDPLGSPGLRIDGPQPEIAFSMTPGGVAIAENGDFVLAGWFTMVNDNAVWVTRLSATGELIWELELATASGTVTDVAIDQNGDIFVFAPQHDSSGVLFKLGPSGEELWAEPLADGPFVGGLLAGVEPILVNQADGDFRLERRNLDGELLATHPLDGLVATSIASEGCRVAIGGDWPARVVRLSGEAR